MVGVKHALKVSSYPENEGFIYCPSANGFGEVKVEFPLRCPLCQKLFEDRSRIRMVLREDVL